MTEHSDVIAEALKDAAGGLNEVSGDALRAISNLAHKQLQLQAEKARLEALTKANDEALKKVSEFDLPNAMADAKMKGFELEDGAKIAVKRVFSAGVKVENRPEAFGWMRERGHESLIKTEVSVPLGKGAHETAEKIIAELKATFDVEAELEESVHWQTLRAFVKEQVESEEAAQQLGQPVDDPLPRELLGVYIIDKAEITLPKPKK